MVVLDTIVVSELMRPKPDTAVQRWIANHDAATLFTTAVTQAEVLLGVALMADCRRKALLGERAADMFAIDFAGRILVFDSAAAVAYAALTANRQRMGRPIEPMAAEIAAIALSVEASLVTRNTRDFGDLGLELHNPWMG